jgi:hypothetical protein
MAKRTRTKNSEKQLAALKPTQFPPPVDAPAGGGRATQLKITMHSASTATLTALAELIGEDNKSLVVRKALAYAEKHKEDFLKEFGVKQG